MILLAKAQVIDFVPQICDELIVPSGTADEVRQGQTSDDGRRWLENAGKVFAATAAITSFGLGLGETQVLAWVHANRGFEAVLDDLKVRHCAKALNLPVVGSMRVLIILKEKGLIPAIKPALDKFRTAGSYFSPALISEALKIAGET